MAATTSTILGPDGRPIRLKELAAEPQTARVAWLRSEYANHPTRGLTPAGLASLYEDAEGGDLMAQAQLAEDMEEKDAHLFAELSKRKLAWLTVDWDLVPPAAASAQEKADCAALEAILREEMDLDQLLLDLAGAILPGYACIELEWAQSGGQWRCAPRARPADWFTVDPAARDTPRLRDGTPYGEAMRPWGWIVHRHPAKSGYLTRAGLVRVLGWPFLFRNLPARDLAEFLEIYGLPLRLGRYPLGASDEEKTTLMSAVVNIGHAAAGILPEGMAIEFQQAAQGSADPFLAMMYWAEQSISKAILGGTLTSAVDGKGSYAAAQVHNEVRGDILRADLRLAARSLSRDLVAPLARLNTRLQRLPTFRFDLGEAQDLAALADALPKLAAAGLPIPLRWVQDKLRIPAPEEGEPVLQRAPAAAPVAPMTAALSAPADHFAGVGKVMDTPNPADEIADRLAQEAAPAIAAWIDRIAALTAQAESLDALKGLILAAYGDLPSGDLAQALAAATVVANLAGRYDVEHGGHG